MNVPTCNEAEDALVSILLTDPDKVAPLIVNANLDASSFMQPDVWAVIDAALTRWKMRHPVDAILIGQEVKAVCPPHRMMQLATCCTVPSAAQHYLAAVLDADARRKLIKGCNEAALIAGESGKDECLDKLAKLVTSVNQKGEYKPCTVKELLKKTVASFDEDRSLGSVPTGMEKLDAISPVRRGDLVVIAAQAKGGKSTLALSYACNVSGRGENVLFFSLEMPAADITEKLLARMARVKLGNLYYRNFAEADTIKMQHAIVKMSKWDLEIRDDCHNLNQLVATARMAHARKPLTLMVVDYLQLVRSDRSNGDSREREVAEVSRTLRLLALEMNCVIVALSQLNDDGRLRESRAIGQDATAVWAVSDSSQEGFKSLFIPAQRNAESNVGCELQFRGEYASFD